MDKDFWKKVFLYGAYWNWSFAAIGIIFPRFARMIMDIPENEGTAVFQVMFFWIVALFGLAYWWVSRDPFDPASKRLVQMGIIGKLLVFLYFTHYFFSGIVSAFAFAGAVGDLIFSIFFAVFLIANRSKFTSSG